jgi:hypothetical protein
MKISFSPSFSEFNVKFTKKIIYKLEQRNKDNNKNRKTEAKMFDSS